MEKYLKQYILDITVIKLCNNSIVLAIFTSSSDLFQRCVCPVDVFLHGVVVDGVGSDDVG